MRVPIAPSSLSKATRRQLKANATAGPPVAVPSPAFSLPPTPASRALSSPLLFTPPGRLPSGGCLAYDSSTGPGCSVFGELRLRVLPSSCNGLLQRNRFFSVTPPPVYNGATQFREDEPARYPPQEVGYEASSYGVNPRAPYAAPGTAYDAAGAGTYGYAGAPAQTVPGYPPYGAQGYGAVAPGAPYGSAGTPGYYPPQGAPHFSEETGYWPEGQAGAQQAEGYWGDDQRHVPAQGYPGQVPGYAPAPGAYPPSTPYPMHGAPGGVGSPQMPQYPAAPGFPDQGQYSAPYAPAGAPGGYGGFGAAPAIQPSYYSPPHTQAPGGQATQGDESARFQERMMELLQRRLGHKAWLYESALKKGGPEALLRLANDPEVLLHARSIDFVYVLTRFHHAFRLNRLVTAGGAESGALGDRDQAETSAEDGKEERVVMTKESERILEELVKFINNIRIAFKRRDARSEVGVQPFRQTSAEKREGDDAQKIGKGYLLDRARVFHLLAALTLPECAAARAVSRSKLYQKVALPFCAIASEEASVMYDLDITRVRGGVVATMELLRLVGFTGRISHFQHLILEDVATGPDTASLAPTQGNEAAETGEGDADANAKTREELALRRVAVEKEDSQRIWEKLAQVYIAAMDQVRLEHLLPAFTGVSVLFEKDMITRATFLQTVSELGQRMVVPNAFGQNEARGGAAIQLLLEQCTNSMRCQQQNQRLGFSSLRALARIMRETRSDVVIRCLASLSLLRCLREENLGFFSSVLLKRHYRQDVAARQLSPRTLSALIFTHAMTSSRADIHAVELTKVLTSMMGTVERERVLSTEDKCKLAWAICALRLYSREESGGQWDEKVVARLLCRLMEQTKDTSGKLCCFFLEAARECRDVVDEMHPGQGFKDFFPAERLEKVVHDYDRFGYYAMKADVALLRRALLTAGAVVRVSADRQSSQEKASLSLGEAEDAKEAGEAETKQVPESESENAGDSLGAQGIAGSVWEEGALLDGYPVAFYCPERKIAADIDRPARLPPKYMKMRHMKNYLDEHGIRYVIYSEELRHHNEDTFSGFLNIIQNPEDPRSTLAAVPKQVREMWTKRSGAARGTSDAAESSPASEE
ncbi:conserved hypothetical protein [Neospora caninum Liverpool]|uniref:RAP domain-containing protein n=1 Tax=Neospora caninum (strain Liverpool) TaxID=572307 RepID=F0VL02_NEOCL|nr:conserved hypothetical protein [Neospora caninum Liverpool]CBZ54754.1 conserved hypothetical protein [Neospora caninum Liverpool]CEL69471.1 TPA: hypothetical protein BN1204_051800 [Neospora caninum Liverpool]|eukprot:XP_003884782.1 conserved hypothetical protein [Neospora caninum Liverpool]